MCARVWLKCAYLTPKSWSGPPGLWLAVRMKPPYASPPCLFRMTADTAGVDISPSFPIQILPTPFAAAMRHMTGIAVSEKNLPSPDTTKVLPAGEKCDLIGPSTPSCCLQPDGNTVKRMGDCCDECQKQPFRSSAGSALKVDCTKFSR